MKRFFPSFTSIKWRFTLLMVALGIDRKTAIMYRVNQDFSNGVSFHLSEDSPRTCIVDCHLNFKP